MTFFGPTCDALRAGSIGELIIVYGCPPDGSDGGGGGGDGLGGPAGVTACAADGSCDVGFTCSSGCCILNAPF